MGASEPRNHRIPGPLWLVGGLLSLNFTVVGFTLYLANSDPTFAVEPDYYGKAVRWDAEQACRERAGVLGWTLDVDAAMARSATGMRTLTLRIADRDHQSVCGAAMSVECFSHKDAAHRFTGACIERGPGVYQIDVPFLGEGLHEVRAAIDVRGESILITSITSWADAAQ